MKVSGIIAEGDSGTTTYGYDIDRNNLGEYISIGVTNSSNLIPAVPADVWQQHSGGGNDGFVCLWNIDSVSQFPAKISTPVWRTFYGGEGSDEVRRVAFAPDGDVIISGTTNSNSGIASTGVHQFQSGGANDAFIARLSPDGKRRRWGTYFGGAGDEELRGLVVDRDGNIYITGTTKSTNGIAKQGDKSQLNGAKDGFLAKFDKDGALIWGTYIGGDSVDEANGIALDSSGNIVVGGSTNSTQGIATPWGYHDSFRGDTLDGFVRKYTRDGVLLWGTYIGGDKMDQVNDITTDPSGKVYAVGVTQSANGIAVNSATSISAPPFNDVFVVRLIDELHKAGGSGVVSARSEEAGISVQCDVNQKNTISVRCEVQRRGRYQVEVRDILGRECGLKFFEDDQTGRLHEVRFTVETSGAYLVTVSGPQGTVSSKVILQQ